ncbi:MAG: VanZ family protein [Paludibacter sp.]|jgi:VanZ family protein|nr:VanZ family protein [Paludibacter sp.]
MIAFIKNYWKSALVTVAILVISFANPPELPEIKGFDFGTDKIVHIIMYLALAAAMILEYFVIYGNKKTWKFWLRCGGFPAFIAIFTEVCQGAFFPTRSCDLDDFVADVVGILIAFLCQKIIFNISKTKSWLTKI